MPKLRHATLGVLISKTEHQFNTENRKSILHFIAFMVVHKDSDDTDNLSHNITVHAKKTQKETGLAATST